MALPVTIGGASPDELRQLRDWLLAEDELRGGVEMIERTPDPGRLGPILEGLRILADPGGAVLASVLVAWIKQRRSSVKVRITGRGGKCISIDAERVRLMSADDLSELTGRIARVAAGEEALGPPGTTDAAE